MLPTALLTAAPLLLLLLGAAASAQTSGTTAREHGAHAHGHGVLEVAQEGHELQLELRIPAINVVGFEHAPASEEQRQAVQRALATFKRGQDLFVPSAAARCELESAEVALGEERESGKEHGHAHDKKAHAVGEAHSELHATWHFHCDAPDKLERLEVKVFQHLLEVDELDARVVTATLQKAVELRPGNATLELTTR